MQLREILSKVESGELSAEAALTRLGDMAERNLGFARVDLDRVRRRGMPEVIYSPGKTSAQIVKIMTALIEAGQDVMATRTSPEQWEAIRSAHPAAEYHPEARLVIMRHAAPRAPSGRVAVVCAGTSDIPVAEEAALTAECAGAAVDRFFDVGVAGLHRLLNHLEALRRARVLVVVAGMEGALPSVVGGLVDKPIIAVPTSVGYGTGLHGISALLSMLNTCVPGITVVNIDNGFGAGIAAAMVNNAAGAAP